MPKEFPTAQREFLDNMEIALKNMKKGQKEPEYSALLPIYEALMDGNSVLAVIFGKLNNIPASYLEKISKLWNVGAVD